MGGKRAWKTHWFPSSLAQSWSPRYAPTLCGCGFCCCHLPLAACHTFHFAAALKFKACNFMLLIFRSIKSCGFGSHKLHCREPLPSAPRSPLFLALSSLRCNNEFLQHLLQGYCPLIKIVRAFLGKFPWRAFSWSKYPFNELLILGWTNFWNKYFFLCWYIRIL